MFNILTTPSVVALSNHTNGAREDGSLLIDGQYQLEELFVALNIEPSEEEEDGMGSISTIAGLVLLKLGHMPTVGERVQWQGYTFEVMDMDGNRIDKILVTDVDTQL